MFFPRLKTKPNDSNAATVINIPRKKSIDGISILDNALNMGLEE